MQLQPKRSTCFFPPQEQPLRRRWHRLTWSDGGERQDHRSGKRDQDGHVDAVDQKSRPLAEGALRKRRTTATSLSDHVELAEIIQINPGRDGAGGEERSWKQSLALVLEDNNSRSFSGL